MPGPIRLPIEQLQAQKTTLSVYKDCLRAIRHACGRGTPKELRCRQLVNKEFRKNMHLTDKVKIEELRKDAILGVSRYITMQSLMSLRVSKNIPSYQREALRKKLIVPPF